MLTYYAGRACYSLTTRDIIPHISLYVKQAPKNTSSPKYLAIIKSVLKKTAPCAIIKATVKFDLKEISL